MNRSMATDRDDNNGDSAYGNAGFRRLRLSKERRKKVLHLSRILPDSSHVSLDETDSAGSYSKHVAASLIQRHRSSLSPASYGNSMEVAPFNCSASPSSSVDVNGGAIESRKTSTELLEVLSKIWSLEERQSNNISIIKALKVELQDARSTIRDMLRDKEADRRKVGDLMKQFGDENTTGKCQSHDGLRSAVQELEDERTLRRRSESMQRKIARELAEVKNTLSNSIAEVERERNYRKTLEELCDEFARGVRVYEKELRSLRHKSERIWAGKDESDHLLVHLSDSWIDEYMQMKLNKADFESTSVMEKIESEVEYFLKARRKLEGKRTKERRSSMDSLPLNDAMSEPKVIGEEDDSQYSYVHGFTEKNRNDEEDVGRGRSPSQLQTKFEKQMLRAVDKRPHTAEMAVTRSGTSESAKEKDHSLKMKLLEARFIGSRYRLKILKGSA